MLISRVLLVTNYGSGRHCLLPDIQSRSGIQAQWEQQIAISSRYSFHVSLPVFRTGHG
jgi:hypothetical protein